MKADVRAAERRLNIHAAGPPAKPMGQASRQRIRLAEKLLDVREAERRVLARDLHDGLGQALVILQMQLRSAQACVSAGHQAAVLLDSSIEMVSTLHQEIRNQCLALHSSVLENLGLAPALRSHVAALAHSTGIAVHCECRDEQDVLRWPSAVEIAAFRIAQEALTNAVRHSRASSITVSAGVTGRQMEVCIHDDGVGFNLDTVPAMSRGRSLGLVSMTERARLAGGRLTITSAPGRGTTVCLRFRRRPLRGAHRAQ
jgi:signal transduction histidine kinase